MHIVLASDNNFVQHCSVTMLSILKHNKDVVFHLLTEGLSEKNTNLLDSLVRKNGGQLNIIKVDSATVNRLPMPENKGVSHISIATYYRLFVTSLLPIEVKKVIYLDCDIVVRESLNSLYEQNLDNMALGAVYQDDPLQLVGDEYTRLGYDPHYGYFNAGVLLINLEYWRMNNVEDLLLHFIKKNYHKIKYHDQDVLNAVLHDRTKMLSCKWNMLTSYLTRGIEDFTTEKAICYRNEILSGIEPVIIHFVSRPKPWEWACSHPYKQEYYQYLDETPFAKWRPAFHWSMKEIKYKLIYMFPYTRKLKLNKFSIFRHI